MGQNQSSSNPASPRGVAKQGPPPRPTAPPSKPPTPKTPNYVVPENKVLPNGIGDMGQARKLLRPVSQELTKFHPDFADIFQYDPAIPFEPGDDTPSANETTTLSRDNKENSSAHLNHSSSSNQLKNVGDNTSNFSAATNKSSFSNGDVPKTNGHIPAISKDFESNTLDVVRRKPESATNLRRSQSLEREKTQPVKVPRHRRQASLQTGTSLQGAVIPEDPREHLYNVARHEPFSNVMPSTTSLPLKSSFDLDYSFNLTYAQLAEYRRQKRQNELEDRTGKKMEEMSAEISASNTVPKSPFDRQNLGGKSGTHSVSTGSSETGVSKSKKKKAPAPPPPPGAVPARDKSPGSFSLNTEPPADYDMEDLTTTSVISSSSATTHTNPRQSRSLQRSSSVLSRKSNKSPAPTPVPKSKLNHRQISSISSTPAPPQQSQNPGSPSTPAPLAEPIPPAPPLPDNFMIKTTTTQGASTNNAGLRNTREPTPSQTALQKSMSDARAQLEALKKLENVLKTPKISPKIDAPGKFENQVSTESENTFTLQQSDELQNDDRNNDDNVTGNTTSISVAENVEDSYKESFTLPAEPSTPLDSSFSSTSSATDAKSQFKKMSSLLQHDIVLAAQARGSKPMKTKAPPTLEKPKDAAELFREELVKAALAREARRKEANVEEPGSNKEADSDSVQDEKDVLFKTSFLKVSKKNSRDATTDDNSSSSTTGRENKDKKGIEQVPDDHVTKLKVISSDMKSETSDLDQYIGNISAGEDLDKRPSSMQAENVSLTSSSGSHRVFSPSWTPEDDLDSDDDIINDSYTMPGRNTDTEGFKSSIIPPKLNELKNSKKSKQKKQKQKPGVLPKQSSIESSKENGDEKPAPAAIRKLRRSVHEGMKSALGSLSKASGKLLKKNKSCDFLDVTKEPLPADVPPKEDRSQVSLNPNWEMSGTYEGSRRRRVSDGSVSVPFQNGIDGSETSDDDDDTDADIGDIDFADGIDETPTPRSAKMANGAENMKQLKRAGVAYMSKNGQIVVLPEYETVNVDSEGRVIDESGQEEDGGRAPKIFKKKNKKYAYESTVRVTERNRRDESLSKEIREKEKQIEIERLRQKEMERDFLRLRDLEAQERLQRQITMLQQQQVQQAHASLNSSSTAIMSVDPLSAVPNGTGVGPIHSSFVHSNQMINSSYLPNGHGGGFVGGGPINSTSHLGGSTGQLSHQRYGAPPTAFSTTVLAHHPESLSTTSLNAAPYVNHTAPMVGGGGAPPPVCTPSALSNLSSQDLGYLSEYMKMMGVTPPTTQQQWAVLLSTISVNTPGFTGFEPYQGPHSGYPSTNHHNGPDLTQMFSSGGGGKTLESTTGGSKKQIISLITGGPQSPAIGRNLSPLQRLPQDGLYYKALLQTMMEATSRDGIHNFPHSPHGNQPNTPHPPPPSSLSTTEYNNAPVASLNGDGTAINVSQNQNSYTGDKTVSGTSRDHTTTLTVVSAKSEPEGTARISVPDYAAQTQVEEQMDYTSSANSSVDVTDQVKDTPRPAAIPLSPSSSGSTSALPAKVYGPLGFRPVAFQARSS